MTVYVESNFVIEIAHGQEQSEAAESILAMAESGTLTLAFPTIALEEPFATVTQRGRVRQRIKSQLNEQIKELSRSRPHQQDAALLQTIPAMLTSIEEKEIDLLISTVERLLRVGRAVGYRARFGLSVQDAIILAAALTDLEQAGAKERSYFVSRNWKDFNDPGIHAELRNLNCSLIDDFARLLSLIGP